MKRFLLLTAVILCANISFAQKYAYVDTEYILNNIPAYNTAQKQMEQISQQYQKELEGMHAELDKIYKDYQSEAVLLSAELKRKREDVIITKEKEYKQLQRQYFGPEGDLFKKRQSLVEPIQEDIYNAIQTIATQAGYAVIFDKSSGANMVYTNPKYDLSDEVLQTLGYKN